MKEYIDIKLILLSLLITLMGVGIYIFDIYQNELHYDAQIIRPGQGEAAREEKLTVDSSGRKQEVNVTVSPKAVKEEEAYRLIKQAKREIDKSYLKDNPSPDKVTGSLALNKSYVSGRVDAKWESTDSKLVDIDGTLNYDCLNENELRCVTLIVHLECEGYEEACSFPICISLPDMNAPSGFDYYLQKALKNADQKDPGADKVVLPEKLGIQKLKWSMPRERRGLMFAFLGPLTGGLVALGRKEEERRRITKRDTQISADYPDIVSSLNLYIMAGVTVKSAFTRIFAEYRKGLKDGIRSRREGYEIVGRLVRQMEDGVGEEQAYNGLGELSGNRDFRRLSMMLSDNIKKGSLHLSELLEQEDARGFMMRKQRAKTLGEEASTKMLIPMIMLLGIVLVIMVFPAMMSLKL